MALAVSLLALAAPAGAARRASSGIAGLPPIPIQADNGLQLELGRPAGWALDQHRKLDTALAGLTPQRPGVVDAYVVSIALDSDPVFTREAREAGKVLARRYDAAGHVVVLAGPDGRSPDTLPHGSPQALAAVLARIAELMDRSEDVLILYTSSHGAPYGIVYSDDDAGFGAISPRWLQATLSQLGIKRRVLILSACFSGIFVPVLSSDDSVVVTAAASDRTSFGCVSENDWTFFGDAMINHGLRKPQPLAASFDEAKALVGGWEGAAKLIPSRPQISVGRATATWLDPLEARMPLAETAPVGRPAADALDDARANNH